MALRVISRYKAGALSFEVGQVINDLPPEEEARLRRDSPGSFELLVEVAPLAASPEPETPKPAPVTPKVQAPAANKMVAAAEKKKEA